jgi:uncharacterized oxidoreductase
LDTISPDVVTIMPDHAVSVVTRVFRAAGADEAEAAAIAENLVGASARGHDSHGIVRVPRYLQALERGHVGLGRHVTTIIDSPAFALLDGHHGFGQVLGREAVEAGLKKAEDQGVAVIGLRRSGHLGRIGAWAELAADAGYLSIHFVNVRNSLLVAPFGGAGRCMSTAPVTIGVPCPDGVHFILDFATSRAAEGKALVALKSGKPMAGDDLVDGNGMLTRDPQVLYGEVPPGTVPDPRKGPGALVAMGEHKGSGLALACELLAGALTGSGTGMDDNRLWNGMLSIYMRADAMDDGSGNARMVQDYVDFVRASPPATGHDQVMIPGDPERRRLKERTENGMPVAGEVWCNILDAGEALGLSRAELDAPRAADPQANAESGSQA